MEPVVEKTLDTPLLTEPLAASISDEKTCNATVTHCEELTKELYVLRITPDSGIITPFEPGQYGEIALPPGRDHEHPASDPTYKFVRRPYSIASAPNAGSYYEFFIVLVPDGEITPKLCSQKVGDRVWIGPKVKGKFTLEPVPPESNVVFIATGTGLAPFMSMLRQYHGKGRWNHLAMIHCSRLSQDLAYADELKALAASDPKFAYIPTVTREPSDSPWQGCRGRIQPILEPARFAELAKFELNPETTQVLICGNPEMITSAVDQLTPLGFREYRKKTGGNIHFERFW
ncbi:MAG: ferredoxin--NADP reductase [Deltaproteobacteria bacterium]|nr:ferredoxin--NADP reductase [Deltaproteobacteria bacterium]